MDSKIISLLAVDDNNDNLVSLKALLKESFQNAEVYTALSGKEGIRIAAEIIPDVILLDIVMPLMDGFEVCKTLKANPDLRDIPVVFITANKSDKENRIKALESGADGFLTKPVDESELTAQVSAMIKIRQANIAKTDEQQRLKIIVEERTRELKAQNIAAMKLLDDLKCEMNKRKQTETALVKSEALMSAIAHSAQDAIVVINSRGNINFWNPAAEKLFGYSSDEVMNKNLHSFIAPVRYLEAHKTGFADFIRTGKGPAIGETIELEGLTKKGAEISLELSLSAIELNNEWQAVGLVRDITQRKRNELIQQTQYNIVRNIHKAQNSEHLLEIIRMELGRLVDTTNFFVALYNPETDTLRNLIYKDEKDHFQEWPAKNSISGQVVKMGKAMLMNGSKIEVFAKKYHLELLGTRAACWAGVPVKQGNMVSGAMVVQSYTDENAYNSSDLIMMEMIAHEIGIYIEKQNILEDLIASKEKAEQSDKLKTAFINNISHEIRTPLNGILGFGEFLADPLINLSERIEYNAKLKNSCRRLLDTVSDYMDMAMIVSETIEIRSYEFNVYQFCKDFIEKYADQCLHKNIKIELCVDENHQDVTLNADRALCGKIINKLLENALKFTDKGRICLGFRIESDSIVFFVEDSGKGIAADKLDVIFDMFTQEDMATTRSYEGSGLGLAIVSGIAKKLGGKVWVESEKDKGSVFRFSLPFDGTAMISKNGKPVKKMVRNPIKHIVLLVEDDESNYLFMEVVIRKSGCGYFHAENGAAAVDLCRKYPDITMVIMDIRLPVMEGLEATRLIKELRPDVPVIALTAYAQTGDEEKMYEAGCSEYIQKPIQSDDLKKLIARYCKTGFKG